VWQLFPAFWTIVAVSVAAAVATTIAATITAIPQKPSKGESFSIGSYVQKPAALCFLPLRSEFEVAAVMICLLMMVAAATCSTETTAGGAVRPWHLVIPPDLYTKAA